MMQTADKENLPLMQRVLLRDALSSISIIADTLGLNQKPTLMPNQ